MRIPCLCRSMPANELLLGEDEALLAQLRAAVFEHVQWLIPAGRSLSISADRNTLSLALAQAVDTGCILPRSAE